jgi:squalene-hopene/tetraprenyl-beta-curcumene cyclase
MAAGVPRVVLGNELDSLIDDAAKALRDQQSLDGHWLYELEADSTIPAEYIFLRHFLGEIDDEIEAKLCTYLRRIQADHGGWPLFHGGDLNISASVKAYFALKLHGDDIDAPHMVRAREAILAAGGAARSNVFTRCMLALFGLVPWRAVPVMPVEIMLLPRWFPFHLSKVSYWSRTVIVPLLVLMAKRPRARNPRAVRLDELFIRHPDHERYPMNPNGTRLGACFVALDHALRRVEPLFPRAKRERAIERAMEFVTTRLNGDDGLGGIFPAMANAVMAYDTLGYPRDHPDYLTARQSIEKLLVVREDEAYCQPCLSPVWDTVLAVHTMMEAGENPNSPRMKRAFDWILEREITGVEGDWIWRRPGLEPSGWAFQYWNDYYPDVDDTAVAVMALDRAGDPRYLPAIERATRWIIGMQSANGGWGAFDAENEYYYLNSIPFADHGALLDPPTVDVTARCLSMLLQLGYTAEHPAVAKAIEYLRREQEPDGSWYGRWGVNYVYGTWSALSALALAGLDRDDPMIVRAVEYLKGFQQADGGWGEDCATYWKERRGEVKASVPSQTAWAVLGLMAAGEVDSDAVARGIAYLREAPREDGRWQEDWYTGGGFPRVFYLRYHGYSAYFPLWALAKYRTLKRSNDRQVKYGM